MSCGLEKQGCNNVRLPRRVLLCQPNPAWPCMYVHPAKAVGRPSSTASSPDPGHFTCLYRTARNFCRSSATSLGHSIKRPGQAPRGRALTEAKKLTTISHSNFSDTSGISPSAKIPGYLDKTFGFPALRGTCRTFWPTPSRGRPRPFTWKTSGPKSLSLCSFASLN